MQSPASVKILHLTTHLNIGGITRYIEMVGNRFIRMGYNVSVLSSGGQVESLLEQKGIRCHRLGIRTKSELSPKLWWNLPAAVRLVKNEKFNLIHAHTRVAQVFASVISQVTGIPVVSTAHGFYRPKLGRRLFPMWGCRVIAISPLVAEELHSKHRVSKSRIRLIENAVDIEELETLLLEADPARIRTELGIEADAYVICCISRLVKDKG
ncbi:MAG: glycosyltransferase, partial [Candidatus Omnitrophota bacterium]